MSGLLITLDINDTTGRDDSLTAARYLQLTEQATKTGEVIHLIDPQTNRPAVTIYPLGDERAPRIGCEHARFSVIVTDCYAPVAEQVAQVWVFDADEAIKLALAAAGFSSVEAWAAETDHDIADIRAEIKVTYGAGKPFGTVVLP